MDPIACDGLGESKRSRWTELQKIATFFKKKSVTPRDAPLPDGRGAEKGTSMWQTKE